MATSNGRQFVKYSFYKVDQTWRRLPEEERLDNKREFAAVLEETATHMPVRSYSLVGLRGDMDFLLWHRSQTPWTASRKRPRGSGLPRWEDT